MKNPSAIRQRDANFTSSSSAGCKALRHRGTCCLRLTLFEPLATITEQDIGVKKKIFSSGLRFCSPGAIGVINLLESITVCDDLHARAHRGCDGDALQILTLYG